MNSIVWCPTAITTANTAKDGTGTVMQLFEDAIEVFIERLLFLPIGTNTASVMRVFVNNGGVNSLAANNFLYAEKSLPATTLTEVAAQTPQEIVLREALSAKQRLLFTIGTTVAAGWTIGAVATYGPTPDDLYRGRYTILA